MCLSPTVISLTVILKVLVCIATCTGQENVCRYSSHSHLQTSAQSQAVALLHLVRHEVVISLIIEHTHTPLSELDPFNASLGYSYAKVAAVGVF